MLSAGRSNGKRQQEQTPLRLMGRWQQIMFSSNGIMEQLSKTPDVVGNMSTRAGARIRRGPGLGYDTDPNS